MSKMNTIRHTISVSIIAVTLLGAVPAALANVPQTITQQGRLYDVNQKPVSGALEVTFKIYDKVDATTEIWSETKTITFDEGYFSATLGDVSTFSPPMMPAVFDGSVRYMGVTVGVDPEMTPRAAIQSVPYAMVAGDAIGDIHPTSVTVGTTEIINSMGEWTGASTGLVGPQGPMGLQGPAGADGMPGTNGVDGAQGIQGVQGVQGIQGPQGATGVVSTSTIAGTIAQIPFGGGAAPWVFAGPTATVTVQPGQRITGSAVAVLGHANNNPQTVSFSLCISDVPAGSALNAFFGANYPDGTVAATGNKSALAAAASVVPANVPMGGANYKVGFCVKNKSTNVNLGANDFVNGWFIVTN